MADRTLDYCVPIVLKQWEVEVILRLIDEGITEKDAHLEWLRKNDRYNIGDAEELQIDIEVLLHVYDEVMKKSTAIR